MSWKSSGRLGPPEGGSALPFSNGRHLVRSLFARAELELALVPDEPITVVDAKGHPLGTIDHFRRTNIQPDEIPPILATCFILSEDRRFLSHNGVDVVAMSRAALTNLRRGAIKQGGSTITQQLVKNLFLSRVPRVRRKVPEILAALALERRVTKAVILASYLNTVYFGGRVYGVCEAAITHFRKPLSDLEPSETAVLAALVRSPNFYLTNEGRPFLQRRAQRLLNRLFAEGHIPTRHSPRLPVRQRRQRSVRRRRHLERCGLVNLARTTMATPAGSRRGTRPRIVQLSVHIGMAHRIQKIVSGAGIGAHQAAVIAMRIHDRSMVAAAGIPYDVGVVSRGRVQPGSTFKPFLLIAALEAGYRLSDRFTSEEIDLTFPDGTRP